MSATVFWWNDTNKTTGKILHLRVSILTACTRLVPLFGEFHEPTGTDRTEADNTVYPDSMSPAKANRSERPDWDGWDMSRGETVNISIGYQSDILSVTDSCRRSSSEQLKASLSICGSSADSLSILLSSFPCLRCVVSPSQTKDKAVGWRGRMPQTGINAAAGCFLPPQQHQGWCPLLNSDEKIKNF